MYTQPTIAPPLVLDVTTPADHELTVRVCGELDLLTHGALRRGLDALPLEGVDTVRLQLSELTFCDSRGLRMLLTFVRAGDSCGRRVVIDHPSPVMSRLLALFAPWALAYVAVTPGGLAS